MPLFKHKASSRTPEMEKTNNVTGQLEPNINIGNQSSISRNNLESEHQPLEFHCQMAHGSSTKLISGFSNVRELYQKIGECYDIPSEEVSKFMLHVLSFTYSLLIETVDKGVEYRD